MKLPRRQFLHLAAAAAALPIVSCLAHAQTYPAAFGASIRSPLSNGANKSPELAAMFALGRPRTRRQTPNGAGVPPR